MGTRDWTKETEFLSSLDSVLSEHEEQVEQAGRLIPASVKTALARHSASRRQSGSPRPSG